VPLSVAVSLPGGAGAFWEVDVAGPSVAVVQRLRTEFEGLVVVPGDAGYDDVRQVHNGLIDKRPALIARCRTSSDVSAAVRAARGAGLEISVRGGGHNVAGKAVSDGGLMIDLSLMKDLRVDPAAMTITAGGGVTWGELNAAAYEHGLATTGGVISTTGVAGLTLGGGLGWTMGKYGMAIDNLISADVVLASGEMVRTSADAEPDLFWAIRGGGGNFGVVTSFTFRSHRLSTVLAGPAVHPFPAARDALKFFRQFTQSLPDELTVFAALRHAPDGSGMKLCAIPVCHIAGDEASAERDVKAVREFGPPVMDMIERMPYPQVNTQLDDAFPKGGLNYWKSAFLTELSDEAIDKLVSAFEATPTTECVLVIEHFDGAVTRVEPNATAFPHRARGYNLIIISQWTNPADTDAGVAWARGTYNSLQPHMADDAYINYLDDDDSNRVRAAYGPNYDRLRDLKRRYDPQNVFHLNQNIPPN
jgi:FAD/FMN-containing dehydrogenase